MEGEERDIKKIYKIGQTIGEGSYAQVKRAKHRETGEKVAVKVMAKKRMSKDDIKCLEQEIEILKQVEHPNIVRLIDVFETSKYYCLVMELMEGGELFDKIVEKDHFSEFEAREATKSIIDAIGYCQKLGICHRDIKPENLLLSSS